MQDIIIVHMAVHRSERVYSHVFRMLNEYEVMTDAILLKPNMILPGLDAPVASPEEVAKFTVRTMLRSIPPAVPGIHFLSGGMSEEESTTNLQVRPRQPPWHCHTKLALNKHQLVFHIDRKETFAYMVWNARDVPRLVSACP